MRLCVTSGQIVLGDDDARGPTGETRERLEGEVEGLRVAQVDAGKIFGHLLLERGLQLGPIGGGTVRRQYLRQRRSRVVRVVAHPVEYLDELRGVVRRLHDALQGVAIDAVDQRPP